LVPLLLLPNTILNQTGQLDLFLSLLQIKTEIKKKLSDL
jgi:hypothetical protein